MIEQIRTQRDLTGMNYNERNYKEIYLTADMNATTRKTVEMLISSVVTTHILAAIH
jgi:hypothetical protein